MEKRNRGRNITCPIIFRLMGRISIGEKGKRMDIFENQDYKIMGVGKNIKLYL